MHAFCSIAEDYRAPRWQRSRKSRVSKNERQEHEQNHRLRIGVSFGLVYFFWGSTYLAILIAVRHFPAALLGALRFLIAGALMLGWCALSGKKIAISGKDALRLLLVGVLLLTGGNVVLAWTEQ